MMIQDINKLTASTAVGWRNLTNLKLFAATIQAITPGQTVTVRETTSSATHVYNLATDSQTDLPILGLA
jgi:hypothetical protein